MGMDLGRRYAVGIRAVPLWPLGICGRNMGMGTGQDDRAASQAAARVGVEAPALSSYYLTRPSQGGLLLGYAGWEPRQIRDAVRRLAGALDASR